MRQTLVKVFVAALLSASAGGCSGGGGGTVPGGGGSTGGTSGGSSSGGAGGGLSGSLAFTPSFQGLELSLLPDGGVDPTRLGVLVADADWGDACDAGISPAAPHSLGLSLSSLPDPIQPGSYGLPVGGGYATFATYQAISGGFEATGMYAAVSGTITLTSYDGGEATGSFDLVFDGGSQLQTNGIDAGFLSGTLSGSFDARYCFGSSF